MNAITSAPPPEAPAGSGVTFRRWRGMEEIEGMVAANNAGRQLLGILELVDLEGMRHRYETLVNSDPLLDCLIIERDGVTQGYARMEWHDLADGDRVYDATLVIAPAVWRLGVADAAVGWLEARAAELAAEHPTERTAHIGHFVFGGDLEIEPTLVARGYEAVRWEAELLRPDLEAIGPELLPDGYVMRSPEVAEFPTVFEMYVTSFQEHWGEYEAEDQRIEEWVGDPGFRRELQVVVFHGSQPAAAVHNKLEPQPDGSVRGLLDAVATHPDHRRKGLARAAIQRSLRILKDAGATSAYLGVDTGNHHRAMELYESCGFRQASSGTDYRRTLSPASGGGGGG